MHYVSKIDEAAAQTPKLYEKHSAGFRRAAYVDHTIGSVHMGTGICSLEPEGVIRPHVHSFEESFYILEGDVIVQIGERGVALGAGHFGLISTGARHAWRNTGDTPVRWLEMQAPQPRPFDFAPHSLRSGTSQGRPFDSAPHSLRSGTSQGRPLDYGRDTFFVGGPSTGSGQAVPAQAAPPNLQDPDGMLIGHFDESQLPRPGGPSQMEGFNPVTGVAIKMFVDRSFGAIHQSLFLIQYQPGAKIDPHDHTFEESYFIVSGRVRATADGQTHDLRPGSVIWTSVGCLHSFANVSDEPVRWIETQAPLPPAKEVFRFERDWAGYAQMADG